MGQNLSKWRLLFESAIEPSDFVAIVKKVKSAAMDDGDMEAIRLIQVALMGRPRVESPVAQPLKLPDLIDLNACSEALAVILQAQSTGLIRDEDAKSYRETVNSAVSAFRSTLAVTALEQLEDAAALPFYPPAVGDTVEAFRDFMNGQGGLSVDANTN